MSRRPTTSPSSQRAIVLASVAAVIAVRLIWRHQWVQMDMPRHTMDFAGMAQDAYLHATESCRMSDYHLVSELDESNTSGSVTGKVWVRNDTDVPRHCALAGSVRDGDQVLVQERYELDLAAGEEGAVEVGLAAATVAPWSHEYPNLYTVALELQSEGAEAQRVWYRTGFRRFELRDQRATLNGNPVRFPDRLRWKKGQTELVFEVHNGYNSIDLSECTLRTMFGMEMMQAWRDVPMECPPGQSATVRIPLWSAAAQQSLENDKPIACRCALLDPTGYRPITADILLIPEGIEEASEPRSNSP